MKVLIIGSRIPWPLHDGGAIATYNLLKGLSEKGLQITYLSLNTVKHFVSDDVIKKEFAFLHKIRTRKIDTSIRVHKALMNLFGTESYNIQRFINEDFAKDIQDELNEGNYDILHFEGLFVAAYAELIKSNIPRILRQHNIEFRIWQTLASSAGFPKNIYLRLLARRLEEFETRISSAFQAIVSITEEDQFLTRSLLNYTGRNICIPAGIQEKPCPVQPIDPCSVYHIGSMEWMPNLKAMEWFHSGIWPMVMESRPEAKFYMAGKHMPEFCKKWNTENFIVAGEVPDQLQFIAGKSILVVPLKSGSGIRMKTIEGLMQGKAVVTTSLGALGLPLIHGEHCLIADTEIEFAASVSELIVNSALRERLSKSGQALVKYYYGNDSVTDKWLDFYKSLSPGKQEN